MDERELEAREAEALEVDICVHIFTASAGLVGVCLTVIGLLRIVVRLGPVVSIGDDLLAVNALLFLASCFLAYLALRARRGMPRRRVERLADALFLIALTMMAVICALIAYELV